MAVLDIYIAYIVDWDRFIQVLYLGRAPRTKETLPDFLKWRRVTRPPLVFRGLTGSQRTPRFWGVTCDGYFYKKFNFIFKFLLDTISKYYNILKYFKLFRILILIYVVLYWVIFLLIF